MQKLAKIMLLPSLSLAFIGCGFFLPETPRIPVSGASRADWNLQSFWYYPWGRSGG